MKEHTRYTHGDLPHCKRVRGEEPSLLPQESAEATSVLLQWSGCCRLPRPRFELSGSDTTPTAANLCAALRSTAQHTCNGEANSAAAVVLIAASKETGAFTHSLLHCCIDQLTVTHRFCFAQNPRHYSRSACSQNLGLTYLAVSVGLYA